MNFWPSLSSWNFALAGLVAAAGPVIIHLLNRRRYRVVPWAAMDFLREAIQRNRRILQIRDLILLALRTLAVLLFGLALARPYLAANSQKFDGTQPLHAVLLVDNSLSMGYQTLAGSLLDDAKSRARDFIDKLPRGSRVTLVPLCGSASNTSVDPYETTAAALDALERLEVVDRATSTRQAINDAKRACEALPELSKRLVLISDQQRGNWLDWQPDSLAELPALQVVQVRADSWDNSWISDVRVPDGLADTETPTTIVVEVQHRGSQPRRDVQVTLWIDERPIASQTVTLEPAEGARQISFQHIFDDVAPQAGREIFVPVKATLSPDNLAADDERHLMVPVVAALPVVFVDQYGPDEEDPVRRKLGETRHLRTLLAPRAQRENASPPLIKVRHVKIGDLNRDLLTDTRLVVIAGVNQPGDSIDLLREFVTQGGQLLIAAGGEFDADAWNQAAWRDGQGVLPLPLKPAPIGATPDEAGARLQPFQIAFEGLAGLDYFRISEASEDDMRDLFSEPYFFKAVEVDSSDDVLQALRESDRQQLTQLQATLRSTKPASQAVAKGSDSSQESADDSPRWLQWSRGDLVAELPLAGTTRGGAATTTPAELTQEIESAVLRRAPRIMARYALERSPAFLVERSLGAGTMVFCSTGLLSEWSTLPKTNTMFVFDRLLRGMIEATLARRVFEPREQLSIPLVGADPSQAVRLRRPGQTEPIEELDLGFVGRDVRGVTISAALARGTYRLVAAPSDSVSTPSTGDDGGKKKSGDEADAGRGSTGGAASEAEDASADRRWQSLAVLAINGPADESDLTPLSDDRREGLLADNRISWVNAGEAISLAGAQLRGQDSWWYLALIVLGALLLEMFILARSHLSSSKTTLTT